jgi:hypothetical protein
MEQYYVMHRQGTFKPAGYTANQCKAPKHPDYHYELVMVFDGDAELDERKFLLDHQEVDDMIQSLRLGGSCEQMHQRISKRITSLMRERDLPMVACKCIIRPSVPVGAAHLKFVSFETGHEHCLALT